MPRRKPFTGPVFVHGYLSILDIVWSNSDGQCSYNICIKWSNWTVNIYKNTILLKLCTNCQYLSKGLFYWVSAPVTVLALASRTVCCYRKSSYQLLSLEKQDCFHIFSFSSVIFQKGINKGRRIRTRRVSLKSSNILVNKYFLVLNFFSTLVGKYFPWCSNVLAHWWTNIFLGAQMFEHIRDIGE